MKKSIALLFILLLIFSVIGCTATIEEIEEITGYIVIIDNVLHLRHVEIVKIDDKDRMDEFLTHLGDLNDIPLSEQKIPYFIKIQNGKVDRLY